MKAALFAPTRYIGPAPAGWPVPVDLYSSEIAQQSMNLSLDQFALADELGFDWVTLAEHHFAPLAITPNPFVLAGAVTQRVKRAKIALLGPNIPVLNPVRVAEEFSMLDTMTGGRIIAGMMRGTTNEYVTYNTNPAESRERFQEAMSLIIKAWTEPQPFGWQGRYFEFRSISIWPRPVQQPHPPVYMSGSSPESGEFAARNHVGLGFAVTRRPLAAKAAAYYREQANLAGWDPRPDDIIYRIGVTIGETDAAAREATDRAGAGGRPVAGFVASSRTLDEVAARLGYYGRDAEAQRGRVLNQGDLDERIEQGQVLFGGPDSILKQIKRIQDDIGAGVLDLSFAGGTAEAVLRGVGLFGTKVLPRLHEM